MYLRTGQVTETFTHTNCSALGVIPLPNEQPPPFPSSDKPCELYCSPLGKESPLLVADRVLDGTPCGPYETDLCVYGRCQVTYISYCPWRGYEERVLLPPEWAHGEAEAFEGQGE